MKHKRCFTGCINENKLSCRKFVIRHLPIFVSDRTVNERKEIRRSRIKCGMTPLFNNGGFTLIELLVVVLIIGILAAVALPQYNLAVKKSRFTEYNTVARSLAKMIENFYTSTGSYPEYWDQLDIDISSCSSDARLGDLVCKNFFIDLNSDSFVLRDDPNSVSNTRGAKDISVSYRFLYGGDTVFPGGYNCVGRSSLGKQVCKSVCKSENCFYK